VDITGELAYFASSATWAGMPELAKARSKDAALDNIGVALVGSHEPVAKLMASLVREQAGKPESTVLGAGFNAPASQAALANGVAMHSMDYDDQNSVIIGHPSAVLLPAVLAMAEATGASGKALLEAYVTGFEVEARIARGMNPAHFKLGWHSTATLGSLGSAVAVGRILNLGEHEMRYALGIAASEAGGLRQNFGTMTKPYHAGNSARNGVMAAALAARGFTSDPSILDAPAGFAALFVGLENFDVAKVADGLGDPDSYVLANSPLDFKPYPCCGFTHGTVDAMLAVANEYQIEPDNVANIQIGVGPVPIKTLIHHRPQTALQGRFSLEYCASAAIVDKQLGPAQFSDEMVQRASIRDLVSMVSIYEVPEMVDILQYGSRIAVALKDGRSISYRVEKPRGLDDKALTREELVGKFRQCAEVVLSPTQANSALEMLRDLENLSDVRLLTAKLAGNPD
jgi:2-methylcitrate dehydratase PrpD